jgi:4'-phosphopantetheinyl transferase
MLNFDTVFVWLVRLDLEVSEDRMLRWRGWLSEEELARADAFRAEANRHEYITAHAALRAVLGGFLGVSGAEVRFTARGAHAGEKPTLALANGLPNVRFNLSHTSGAALIGVTSGRELGVDIERMRPMDDLDGMARSVMSDAELQSWMDIEMTKRQTAFYRLWTRKESYLKAIGLGLYRDVHQVSVPVSFEPRVDACSVKDLAGHGEWMVQDVNVPEGFAASVCYEGSFVPEIRMTTLDPAEDFEEVIER